MRRDNALYLTKADYRTKYEHMRESVDSVDALRRRIARIGATHEAAAVSRFTLGTRLDTVLGGGLKRGRLHEMFAVDANAQSAAAFTLMLARRAHGKGSILWLRTEAAERRLGQIHGPGIAELGIDPNVMLIGIMPDIVSLLRATADALRCRALGAVIVEIWGQSRELNLTAHRRLAIAAETSGVTGLMLRLDAEPAPSAAETRWQVAAARSAPLEANAPGHPALEITLLRRRGGASGMTWCLEWDRDEHIFREPSIPGFVVPASECGPLAEKPAFRRRA